LWLTAFSRFLFPKKPEGSLPFSLLNLATGRMLSWLCAMQAAPAREQPLRVLFPVTAAIVCGWPLPGNASAGSGTVTMRDYQDLAGRLCKWVMERESRKDVEPPDIHMHPEPMPFDYNDWNDHKGLHIVRHNYH
jgi:hypothetical protein